MNFKELQQKDAQYIANTYKRFPIDLTGGKDTQCHNSDGKEFIDFSSGIGVNSLGFSNGAWADAVKHQIDTLNHISNLYYTQPQVQLAEKLCTRTGMSRVFFANSGAEANEGALKTARKYSHDKYGDGRYEIITLQNSFHGRTIATLSATGQEVFHQHFFPFVEGFSFAEANNLDSVKNLLTDKTCAIMVECIQGEGGVVPLTKDFLQGIDALCKEKDLLLLVDEVQTGVGRTGTFLCCEQYNITPDVVTLAKGLGGGLPIGAVLFNEKTKDTLSFGDHGTTFGGNPIVAAGAGVVLDTIDDAFLANVTEKGAYIVAKANKLPCVTGVTGKGLMLGLSLDGLTAGDVVSACLEQGLILLTAKEKIRLLPPLTITKGEIDKGLAILDAVLSTMKTES